MEISQVSQAGGVNPAQVIGETLADNAKAQIDLQAELLKTTMESQTMILSVLEAAGIGQNVNTQV
ncbi:MAG: hypothetical protein HQK76_07100 [Desulfobacterales bacterium]|nr:hypothetical protein [Desulfobacterales bacterium]